jgi:hypothetical protein
VFTSMHRPSTFQLSTSQALAGRRATREGGRLVLEVGVHAPEPRPDSVCCLVSTEDAEDVVSVPEPSQGLGRGLARARALSDCLRITHAGDDGDQALPQGLAQLRCQLVRRKPCRELVITDHSSAPGIRPRTGTR